jgi:hypothetical protein
MGGNLVLELEPEVLDRVQMGTVLWQIEESQPWMRRQPFLDDLSGGAAVVVHDQNNRACIQVEEVLQKGDEIFLAHGIAHPIRPLTGANVQGAKEHPSDTDTRRGNVDLLADPIPHGSPQRQQLKARLIGIQNHCLWGGLHSRLSDLPLFGSFFRICFPRPGQAWSAPLSPKCCKVRRRGLGLTFSPIVCATTRSIIATVQKVAR